MDCKPRLGAFLAAGRFALADTLKATSLGYNAGLSLKNREKVKWRYLSYGGSLLNVYCSSVCQLNILTSSFCLLGYCSTVRAYKDCVDVSVIITVNIDKKKKYKP